LLGHDTLQSAITGRGGIESPLRSAEIMPAS
jgi:hypothetical protein